MDKEKFWKWIDNRHDQVEWLAKQNKKKDMDKSSLFFYYLCSIIFVVIGIGTFIVYLPKTAKSFGFSLFMTFLGLAFGLITYYRKTLKEKIPQRFIVYSSCLLFTIGGIFMAEHPERFSSRHDLGPTGNRILGIIMIVFMGVGGIFMLTCDLLYYYRHRNDVEEPRSQKRRKDSKNGIIRILHCSLEEAEQTFSEFIHTYHKKKDEFHYELSLSGDNILISLRDVGYDDFCYLVNWLVFRDKQKCPDYSVRGWLLVNNRSWSKAVMFFIPDTETEYDCIYFMTSNEVCMRQSFAGLQRVKKYAGVNVTYEVAEY